MGKSTADAVIDALLDKLAEADEMNVCSAEPTTYYEGCDPAAWQATFDYSLGDVVRPTTRNGYVYECTTDSGSSSGTEPVSWPTTPGNTQVDGGITWTCRNNYVLATGAITGGDFTKADGDTSGRKTTVGAQTGLTIHTTGTGNHVSIVDDASKVLSDVTTCGSQALTSGGTVDTSAFDHEVADPT